MTIEISPQNLENIVNKVLLEVFGDIEKTAKKEKFESLPVRHFFLNPYFTDFERTQFYHCSNFAPINN